MEFNKILQTSRKEAGLTQERLAVKLFISSKTVSNWETGKTTPDIDNLIRLSNLLRISLNDLLLEGSDMVENIKKSAEIRETKIYLWCSSITNFVYLILAFISSAKSLDDKIPTFITLLIAIGALFNLSIVTYFSKKLADLTQNSWKFWSKKKKIIESILFLIFAAIFFAILIYFRYYFKLPV